MGCGGGGWAWKVPERARGAPVRPRAGPGAGWGLLRGGAGCGVGGGSSAGAQPEALSRAALGREGMAARGWACKCGEPIAVSFSKCSLSRRLFTS